MKAKIIKTNWIKEYPSQHGKLNLHKILYDNAGKSVEAFYSSKAKDQNKFIPVQGVGSVVQARICPERCLPG